MKDRLTKQKEFTRPNFLKLRSKNLGGFTLIELLVSIGLFSTVMLIALITLFTLTFYNKESKNIQVATDAVAFLMDDIVRQARFGYNYHCDDEEDIEDINDVEDIHLPKDCGGDNYLAIESGDSGDIDDARDQIVYYFDENDKKIYKSTDSGSNFSDITPESVEVKSLKFYVLGSFENDDVIPRVLITMRATANAGRDNEISVTLQSTATQRFSNE